MRRFTSYGPVDPDQHYAVPRTELIEQCVDQLVGAPNKEGHFFTIWAPRQSGKTWIMRRAREEIRKRKGDQFALTTLTLQGLMKKTDPDEVFLQNIPRRFKEALGVSMAPLRSFEEWPALFEKQGGLFDRPVILLIDEFDSLTPSVIDLLVGLFRQMYLTREAYHLHSLALVGVRAVLGVESDRGSPFNVQRSLHVPNLTLAEVQDLFAQYQRESGQEVEQEVVKTLHEVTRGQPGLCGWFGELLTEKYNPGKGQKITKKEWEEVYAAARQVEPNNTILNLLKKAKEYREEVSALFKNPHVPFSFGQPWCNHLYMNGVIDSERIIGKDGKPYHVCRFSSPFVQKRLFFDLAGEITPEGRVPVLEVLDDVTETLQGMDLAGLLGRYRGYLKRLKAKGENAFAGQARRADLHLTEAVGHFHLYWWLVEAIGGLTVITPEFPTGNGKVDLHIFYEGRIGIIEVKSFTSRADLPAQREQAARYARSKDLNKAVLALFVPTEEEAILQTLSTDHKLSIDGKEIVVSTVAIGQG